MTPALKGLWRELHFMSNVAETRLVSGRLTWSECQVGPKVSCYLGCGNRWLYSSTHHFHNSLLAELLNFSYNLCFSDKDDIFQPLLQLDMIWLDSGQSSAIKGTVFSPTGPSPASGVPYSNAWLSKWCCVTGLSWGDHQDLTHQCHPLVHWSSLKSESLNHHQSSFSLQQMESITETHTGQNICNNRPWHARHSWYTYSTTTASKAWGRPEDGDVCCETVCSA